MNVESLYQDIILDHYKHPRGRQLIEAAAGESHQVNPTCGDEVTVHVAPDGGGHLRVGYEGQGCSISQASASVMSEMLTGTSPAHADEVRAGFVDLMHSKGAAEPDEDLLGDGIAFVGVAKYPARIKCALLPWMALQDAQAKAGIAGGQDAAPQGPDEGMARS
ncbi:MAG: SUF system NifU family Fe-S cluster assembly protein [Actinobacteria bacterium]|nr:SUF system NifU family Fe-S cluster assembly protein [Actinomycetota bacterium]